MSILEIELTPEMAKRLDEQAKQRGLGAKAYAQTVMQQMLLGDIPQQPKRSIMELEGLGADLWRNEHGNPLDAQEYVDALRTEIGTAG